VDDLSQEMTSSRAIWSYIIAADTEADFKMRCSALDPKCYANNFTHLCTYMAHHYEKATTTYVSKYSHFPHLPGEITAWVNNEMTKHDRPKALIIWGSSRTGKTAWARSLGKFILSSSAQFNSLFQVLIPTTTSR
jgi:Cdc6-like AAA superfamily ATPase